jgi:hypothetical protein
MSDSAIVCHPGVVALVRASLCHSCGVTIEPPGRAGRHMSEWRKPEGNLRETGRATGAGEQAGLRGIGARSPFAPFNPLFAAVFASAGRQRAGAAFSSRPFSAVGLGLGPPAGLGGADACMVLQPLPVGRLRGGASLPVPPTPIIPRPDAASLLVGLGLVRITEVRAWPSGKLGAEDPSEPGRVWGARPRGERNSRNAFLPWRRPSVATTSSLRRAVDLTDP